jgi:hypothetical protein
MEGMGERKTVDWTGEILFLQQTLTRFNSSNDMGKKPFLW